MRGGMTMAADLDGRQPLPAWLPRQVPSRLSRRQAWRLVVGGAILLLLALWEGATEPATRTVRLAAFGGWMLCLGVGSVLPARHEPAAWALRAAFWPLVLLQLAAIADEYAAAAAFVAIGFAAASLAWGLGGLPSTRHERLARTVRAIAWLPLPAAFLALGFWERTAGEDVKAKVWLGLGGMLLVLSFGRLLLGRRHQEDWADDE